MTPAFTRHRDTWQHRATNYADMVRESYGPVYRCRCGLVVYPNGTDWRDGSGSEWCWSLNQQHSGRLEGAQR